MLGTFFILKTILTCNFTLNTKNEQIYRKNYRKTFTILIKLFFSRLDTAKIGEKYTSVWAIKGDLLHGQKIFLKFLKMKNGKNRRKL